MKRGYRLHRRRIPSAPTFTSLPACVSAILAAAAQLHAHPAGAADLDEIVVTATRHDVTVSDVPYNISAIGEQEIKDAGITDLEQLTHMIPGLVNPDLGTRAGSVNDTITIRGMNASTVKYDNPAIAAPLVSTYIDETPLFANIKLTDIERVEVLRGPQGTLYGSGSVGGTLRFIHNPPDTTATEVELTTRTSDTANADEPSAGFDAIVNIPANDRLAFRGSAGYEKLSGFTDALSVAALNAQSQPVLANPADPLHSSPAFTEQKGIDSSSTYYMRGAGLWKITDQAQATLSYQHQTEQSDGFSQQRPGYYLAQTLYVDQPGRFETDLAALDVSDDLGFATLSSDTSYTNQTAHTQFDETGLIESLATLYGNYPRIVSPLFDTSHDHATTEELRLVSKDSGRWDSVAGSYYSHRTQDLEVVEPVLGIGAWSGLPGSGMPPGCTVQNPVTCPYPTFGDVVQFYNNGIRPSLDPYPDLSYTDHRTASFRDVAEFGETSYHFTDKWQATAGARIFWERYEQDLTQTLPICGALCSQSGTDPTGLTAAEDEKSFHNQVFKLNTSYSIAPHTLLYVTWSEGYRRGGVNTLPTGSCYFCEPKSLLTYQPDTARNTELGIKGSFDGGSSYTVTVYNIDWRNPQIEAFTVTGGFDYVTNGVSARSRGLETELSLHVAEHLRLELGYSYTDAMLTASFVRGYTDLRGFSGDELPNVSKQQVTAALNYELPIGNERELLAHVDGSYRSDFWTTLPHSPLATDLSGFTLLNARMGIGFGTAWRINAFVNNLTNKIASYAVSVVPGPEHDRADIVGRPRTVGLQLSYSFKGK